MTPPPPPSIRAGASGRTHDAALEVARLWHLRSQAPTPAGIDPAYLAVGPELGAALDHLLIELSRSR